MSTLISTEEFEEYQPELEPVDLNESIMIRAMTGGSSYKLVTVNPKLLFFMR
jgi:hypothetical protein